MTRPGRGAGVLALFTLAFAAGCAASGDRSLASDEGRASKLAYEPDRREYAAFKHSWPDLLEPNYLPFMVHRFEGDPARGDVLVFCRWPDEAMPLRVHIETPDIDPEIQDEFRPVDPAAFVDAVARALDDWEEHLEGVVGFERVDAPGDARLRIAMHGSEAPIRGEGRRVFGEAEALSRACLAHGWDPDRDAIVTSFDLPTVDLHLADEHGLLEPETVRRLALHELGHALGMRGHSPSPGDVMHARLDRGAPRGSLSAQDVNSFLSLYAMPPGTRYGEVPVEPAPPPPPAEPPGGGPMLALAPWVDARFGYEMRLPAGWLRIEEAHGVLVTHGPSWDYDASLRVLVWPAASIDAFLDRYERDLLEGSWFRQRQALSVFGRPAVEIEVEDASGEYVQRYRLIELPEQRVMLLVSEAPLEHDAAWQPWFDAAFATLEIWRGSERLRDDPPTP